MSEQNYTRSGTNSHKSEDIIPDRVQMPREFWITDNTDNSGYTVETEFNHLRHLGSCNVYHTIERSAYDTLQAELIKKRIDYDAHQNLLRKINEANERIVEFERIKEGHNKFVDQLQKQLNIAVESLNYIESHKWASNTNEPHKWINEFCEVSRIALEQINKLKGEK